MQTSVFLLQNTSTVSKFMVCPHGQGREGVELVSDKRGRGSIFRDFVRTSFMDGPLVRVLAQQTENK